MKKLLMTDEDYRLTKRMEDVEESMADIISDLYEVALIGLRRDEVIECIESAVKKVANARCIFVTDGLVDYDEWTKDDNVQTKKEKT